MKRILSLPLAALFLACAPVGAHAQSISPSLAPSLFASLAGFPSFIWSGPQLESGKSRWEGNYASVSSGFSVTKFKGGPTVASPEIGLALGRNWREGNLVWGVEMAGTFSPITHRIGGPAVPLFADYSRDLSGIARIKAGVLLNENLLVYSSIGAVALRENWRSNTAFAPHYAAITRDEVRVAPDIRAGVQWQAMPGLTLGLEVGAQPGWR
jgi:outer membrane immunogenic protein